MALNPAPPHSDLVYANSNPVQNIHRQSQTIPALLAVKLNGVKLDCSIIFNIIGILIFLVPFIANIINYYVTSKNLNFSVVYIFYMILIFWL